MAVAGPHLNSCQFNNANTAYDVYFVDLSCDEVDNTLTASVAMIFMLRLLSLGINSTIPIFLTSHYLGTRSDLLLLRYSSILPQYY